IQWKPTCKSGTARWVYDGVCPDADVFAALLNLPEPPKWKQKKFAIEEFENALGDSIRASTRYSSLYLRGDVNVRWNPAAGEFKFSGSYGV
ncbi:uncharacterized protein EI90DRAFT_2906798, partial [Cantharellus anzutake]|uniref:uncharacterized protein n=1 Tax=Cantharellus anzutake TaxID=1750568 RepID=UPI001903A417